MLQVRKTLEEISLELEKRIKNGEKLYSPKGIYSLVDITEGQLLDMYENEEIQPEYFKRINGKVADLILTEEQVINLEVTMSTKEIDKVIKKYNDTMKAAKLYNRQMDLDLSRKRLTRNTVTRRTQGGYSNDNFRLKYLNDYLKENNRPTLYTTLEVSFLTDVPTSYIYFLYSIGEIKDICIEYNQRLLLFPSVLVEKIEKLYKDMYKIETYEKIRGNINRNYGISSLQRSFRVNAFKNKSDYLIITKDTDNGLKVHYEDIVFRDELIKAIKSEMKFSDINFAEDVLNKIIDNGNIIEPYRIVKSSWKFGKEVFLLEEVRNIPILSKISSIHPLIGITTGYTKVHTPGMEYIWEKLDNFAPNIKVDNIILVDKDFITEYYKGMSFNNVVEKVKNNYENDIIEEGALHTKSIFDRHSIDLMAFFGETSKPKKIEIPKEDRTERIKTPKKDKFDDRADFPDKKNIDTTKASKENKVKVPDDKAKLEEALKEIEDLKTKLQVAEINIKRHERDKKNLRDNNAKLIERLGDGEGDLKEINTKLIKKQQELYSELSKKDEIIYELEEKLRSEKLSKEDPQSLLRKSYKLKNQNYDLAWECARLKKDIEELKEELNNAVEADSKDENLNTVTNEAESDVIKTMVDVKDYSTMTMDTNGVTVNVHPGLETKVNYIDGKAVFTIGFK